MNTQLSRQAGVRSLRTRGDPAFGSTPSWPSRYAALPETLIVIGIVGAVTFSSNGDGSREIYVSDAEGLNLPRLMNDAGIDEHVARAPIR